MDTDIMGGQETADYLGVSYAHLYKLMKRGLLTRLEEPDEIREKVPLRFRRAQVEELKRNAEKKSRNVA